MVNLALVERRFKTVCMVSKPTIYEAFCYQIDIRDTLLNSTKHYIGWHAGRVEDIDDQEYLHSSKCPELEQAIAIKNNIITYNIIAFGGSNEMATLEHTELAKVHAITNPSYYNKTNGGGRHVLNLNKQEKMIDNIIDNISLNNYPIEFYNRNKLVTLGAYQVRLQQFERGHVNNLKDIMKKISEVLPDSVTGDRPKIDPIVILMPKDKDDAPKIIGGNYRRSACIAVPLMDGLDAIEVPYKDWNKLTDCDIQTLGLQLNPMEEKVRMANNLDDIANWIVNLVIHYKLYKNVLPFNSDDKPIVWWNHSHIEKYIARMNILKNQKGPLIQKAIKVYEEKTGIKLGINQIDWREASLENTPDILAWYNAFCKSKMALRKYDTIIKVSSERFLWEQISDKVFDYGPGNSILSYPNLILVLVFLPLNYDTNVITRTGWQRQLKRWNEFEYPSFLNKMTIDLEILPRTTDGLVFPSPHDQ